MKSGIYLIRIGKKCYIGSAVKLTNRKATHLYRLRRDTHANPYLQRSFRKYGMFLFQVIETCPKEKLLEREQYWLDKLAPELNIQREVKNPPMLGRKQAQHVIDAVVKGVIKSCYQYSLKGKFIRKWSSITKAAVKLEINGADITSCCRNRMQSAGGFIWRYNREKVNPYCPGNTRAIVQLKNGKIVRRWTSLTKCAGSLKISLSMVSKHLTKPNKSINLQYEQVPTTSQRIS